jgi:hypothetical protein
MTANDIKELSQALMTAADKVESFQAHRSSAKLMRHAAAELLAPFQPSMTPEQQSTLWIGAFRYYCGRMTYAVGDFCDLLVSEWPSLPENARKIIELELEDTFKRDDEIRFNDHSFVHYPLGHDCDKQKWAEVRALWLDVGDVV